MNGQDEVAARDIDASRLHSGNGIKLRQHGRKNGASTEARSRSSAETERMETKATRICRRRCRTHNYSSIEERRRPMMIAGPGLQRWLDAGCPMARFYKHARSLSITKHTRHLRIGVGSSGTPGVHSCPGDREGPGFWTLCVPNGTHWSFAFDPKDRRRPYFRRSSLPVHRI